MSPRWDDDLTPDGTIAPFELDGTWRRTMQVGQYGDGRRIVVTIALRDAQTAAPSLSITGEIWRPRAKDCDEGGQIACALTDDVTPLGGWTREGLRRLRFIWDTYHLNDMQAGCEHQRAAGWKYAERQGDPECPVCGYRIGSQWRRAELPADVRGIVGLWLMGHAS